MYDLRCCGRGRDEFWFCIARRYMVMIWQGNVVQVDGEILCKHVRRSRCI